MMEWYELAGRQETLRFSPYCWRVRMALAHKGLEARALPWHFGQGGLPERLTHVPVLVDAGQVFGDSTKIALHLEEAYPNGPSLFGGETAEAATRFIIAWTDDILLPAMLPVVAPYVLPQLRPQAAEYFRRSREARLGMTLEQAAAEQPARLRAVRDTLAPVRRVLQAQAFLGGAEPAYADYVVFGAFQWARCVGAPELLEDDSPVHAWREAMLDQFDGLAREAEVA